jgi:mRNA interferase RelE/StbE
MGMFRVQLLESAVRALERLDKTVGARIVQRINWLAENFEVIEPKRLTGELAGLYKLRDGDYRIIYQVLRRERTIVVHTIGHRKDVYRRR